MSKDELRLTIVISFVISILSFYFYIENKVEVEYNKEYFSKASDICKQEYIDYNLERYWSLR